MPLKKKSSLFRRFLLFLKRKLLEEPGRQTKFEVLCHLSRNLYESFLDLVVGFRILEAHIFGHTL